MTQRAASFNGYREKGLTKMAIYIALLRGINVGGKNKIKMADLKRSFDEIGLERVQTYIQSGNVLFESDKEEESLRNSIEHKIEEVFGFKVSVILRTSLELERIIQNCPFSEEEILKAENMSDTESLYAALLTQTPSKEGTEQLNAYRTETDDYRINGREVYLLFHNSIRNSKLANNLHKLNVPVTVRNWKTMVKLAELSRAMQS